MKRIEKAQDMPADTARVVLAFTQIFVDHDGDERSRTNPGHGYPAYRETIQSCEVYAGPHDDADFQSTLEILYARNRNIVVLTVESVLRPHAHLVVDVQPHEEPRR